MTDESDPHLAGVLAMCLRAEPVSRHQSIRAYCVDRSRGFFKGRVSAIARTWFDGYLWLGTEFGLFRFDGVRKVQFQLDLPSNHIFRLLTDRDGRLWIATAKGLASWKDGKLSGYPEFAGQYVVALLQDRQGTVWASALAGSTGRLCAIQGSSVRCDGGDGRFGLGVLHLYEDSRGNLWAAANSGLWRWSPGPPIRYALPEIEPHGMIEGDNGALWIGLRGGIRQLVNGKIEAYPLPGVAGQYNPISELRDRNGGVWISTADRGLLHLHQGRTDVFAQSDGLSGNTVQYLYEDREGDVWAATANGLDRFRDFAVPSISVKQGLSNASVQTVLSGQEGWQRWAWDSEWPEQMESRTDDHLPPVQRRVPLPGRTGTDLDVHASRCYVLRSGPFRRGKQGDGSDRVRSLRGRAGESCGSATGSRVFFACLRAKWWNGFRGRAWERRTRPRLYCLILCGAVCGSRLPRAAWSISKKARLGHRTPQAGRRGWARVMSPTFSSMGTVRFGPRPRVG